MSQCLCHCQLFVSVSVALFGEIMNYIIAKWRHSDVSTMSVSEKNDSVPFHLCTDTDRYTE